MSKLKHKTLYLEKISLKHIDEGWLDWVNRSSNVRALNRPPYRYNKKQLIKYLGEIKKKGDMMFAVRLKKNKEYIGNIRLNDIDYQNRSCTYGRLLGNTKYRGKGFGTLFLYKICQVAFEKLKLRLGGYFRSHFRKKNKYKDVYYVELTNEEFKKIKNKFR